VVRLSYRKTPIQQIGHGLMFCYEKQKSDCLTIFSVDGSCRQKNYKHWFTVSSRLLDRINVWALVTIVVKP